MGKDKRPNQSLIAHLTAVGISAEVLKALMHETAESGWAIEDLWDIVGIEEMCRHITRGALVRVKNEVAVAIAEKNLGITKFKQN